MRRHRFYLEDLSVGELQALGGGDTFTIQQASLHHQVTKVLRLHEGDEIIVFADGTKSYISQVTEVLRGSLVCKVMFIEEPCVLPEKEVVLVVPALRKERLEWLVEKATELGVRELLLIDSERAQPRGFSMSRLQKIMIEACEQCGRNELLHIKEEDINVAELVKKEEGKAIVLVPGAGKTFPEAISEVGERVAVLIGPEGGWSDAELSYFDEKQVLQASLGSLVLRAETAAIAAVSVVVTRAYTRMYVG